MMIIKDLPVTTDASGNGTKTLDVGRDGFLVKVEWEQGDFAATVDATLANVNTQNGADETLLQLTNVTADATYRPRVVEHDATGTALTTTTFPMVRNNVKLTIAQGGNTKTGLMRLYILGA